METECQVADFGLIAIRYGNAMFKVQGGLDMRSQDHNGEAFGQICITVKYGPVFIARNVGESHRLL